MKAVGVEFKDKGKLYTFFDNDLEIKLNDKVIVNTERGLQFGKIGAIFGELNDGKDHALVYKIATEEDEIQNQKNVEEAEKALIKAQEIAEKTKLDMKFLDAFFTFDRKQLVFQFLSDNRIDFRELAKSLAGIYKTRIELRQVGPRNKAKIVGGIGNCGMECCCSRFMSDFDTVSINMAKNQLLALNIQKLSGQCGKLMCCLRFENEEYTRMRKDLPKMNSIVSYQGKKYRISSMNVLQKQAKLENKEEVLFVDFKELWPDKELNND